MEPDRDTPAIAPVPRLWAATAVEVGVACEVMGTVELVGDITAEVVFVIVAGATTPLSLQ